MYLTIKYIIKHFYTFFNKIDNFFKIAAYLYMMKVINIDFENKTFETDNGEIFPLMFDVDETITLEEFQELVDKSENAIKEVLA